MRAIATRSYVVTTDGLVGTQKVVAWDADEACVFVRRKERLARILAKSSVTPKAEVEKFVFDEIDGMPDFHITKVILES